VGKKVKALKILTIIAMVLLALIVPYSVIAQPTVETNLKVYFSNNTLEIQGQASTSAISEYLRIDVENVQFRDLSGEPVETLHAGTPASLEVPIVNLRGYKVDFIAYLMIYKGLTVVSPPVMMFGSVDGQSNVSIGFGWMPRESGEFTLKVFIFKNAQTLKPLTNGYLEVKVPVDVEGEISKYMVSTDASWVSYKVINPKGVTIVLGMTSVNVDGTYECTLFKFPDEETTIFPSGTYKITVIDVNGESDTITITFEGYRVIIHGIILDTNGTPLQNIVVYAMSNETVIDVDVTNENGNFTLKVTPGTYTIVAGSESFSFKEETYEFKDVGNYSITIVLERRITPTITKTITETIVETITQATTVTTTETKTMTQTETITETRTITETKTLTKTKTETETVTEVKTETTTQTKTMEKTLSTTYTTTLPITSTTTSTVTTTKTETHTEIVETLPPWSYGIIVVLIVLLIILAIIAFRRR